MAFRSIECLSISDKYIYKLIDDDFECEVVSHGIIASSAMIGAVVAEYQRRNLPVAKNIALLYLFFNQKRNNIQVWIKQHCNLIDYHIPELEYGKKYYPCVINQIKMMSFVAGK